MEYTAISANLVSRRISLHFGLQKNLGQHDNNVRVVVHLHSLLCCLMHVCIKLNELTKDFPELSRYTKVALNVDDVVLSVKQTVTMLKI